MRVGSSWTIKGKSGELRLDEEIIANIIQWEVEIHQEVLLIRDASSAELKPVPSWSYWEGCSIVKPLEGKEAIFFSLATEPKMIKIKFSEPFTDISLEETKAIIISVITREDGKLEISFSGTGNLLKLN